MLIGSMILPAQTLPTKRAKEPKNSWPNLWSKILIKLAMNCNNNNKHRGLQFLKFKISTTSTSELKNIPIWTERRKDKTLIRSILFKNKKYIILPKNKRKPSTSKQ